MGELEELEVYGTALVGWLVGFSTSSSATRLPRGRDHDLFQPVIVLFIDTDPTRKDGAQGKGIELRTFGLRVASSTDLTMTLQISSKLASMLLRIVCNVWQALLLNVDLCTVTGPDSGLRFMEDQKRHSYNWQQAILQIIKKTLTNSKPLRL